MKKYIGYKAAAVLILAAVVWIWADSAWGAAPEIPSHKSVIFTPYFPKNGQGNYISSGFDPGFVMDRMETFYEGWWREYSYYRANPTNGTNVRGFYMDTKTLGENSVPWPWNPGISPIGESPISAAVVGTSVLGVTNIYRGTLNPCPISGRPVVFQIGTAFVSDGTGSGLLGGDGNGYVNFSDGRYEFTLNVAVPAGLDIQATYVAQIMGNAGSPAAWANFDGVIDDLGRRTPNGRGEQFNEDPDSAGQLYPRIVNGEAFYDPLQDGVWTPGERFTDTCRPNKYTGPNRSWDPYLHGEDTWTPTHSNMNAGIGPTVLPGELVAFLSSMGDSFADYNFNTTVASNQVTVGSAMAETSVQIWIADIITGTNVKFSINEMDLTPPLYYENGVPYYGEGIVVDSDPRVLEGDAGHTYNRDGNSPPANPNPSYQSVPAMGRFEYEVVGGQPLVFKSPNFVIVRAFLAVGYARQFFDGGPISSNIVNTVDGLTWIGIGSPWTYVKTSPVPLAEEDQVSFNIIVPIFYARPIWGQPAVVGTYLTPVGGGTPPVGTPNRFTDCIGGDNQPTPSMPEEPFEDFLSWWLPTGGAGGRSGTWVTGVSGHPVVGNLGAITGPGVISYAVYTNYIYNNYPGDAEALIARCGNRRYDGPDDWAEVSNNQYMQNGFDRLCTVIKSGYGSSGWIVNYDTWWREKFGANSMPFTELRWPNMAEWKPQLHDRNQDSTGRAGTETNVSIYGVVTTRDVFRSVQHPPGGTTWTYDSPREFYDLASSLYHNPDLGALSSIQMSRLGRAFDAGGDLRFGEVTCSSRADWSIRGVDIGDNDYSSALGVPDMGVPLAGPYAYNIHGEHKLDAGSQANTELSTWRTDGKSLTGPRNVPGHVKARGYCYLAGGSEIEYQKDHRDVNLNGLVDQGETIPVNSHNYFIDADPVTPNDGMRTRALFGWERLIEDCFESWDTMEDMAALRTFNDQMPYEYSLQTPSTFIWAGGMKASGTINDPVPVAYRERGNDGIFTPGYDPAWLDVNSNLIFDSEALLWNPMPLAPTNEGRFVHAAWADLNKNGSLTPGWDLVWLDEMPANGIFDSEPVLSSRSLVLKPGEAGVPIGLPIYVWSTNATPPYLAVWALTNSAITDATNILGSEGYVMIMDVTSGTNRPGAGAVGLRYDSTKKAAYGDLYYIPRRLNDLGYVSGDDVFIDTDGDGRYTSETVITSPGKLVDFAWTSNAWAVGVSSVVGSLAQTGTVAIAHTTNTAAGVFDRMEDAAWLESVAPSNMLSREIIMSAPVPLVQGYAGTDFIPFGKLKYIDVAPPGGVANGVYDPLYLIEGAGPEGGDWIAGDAVFYDNNGNDAFDTSTGTILPLYAVALYNQTGVSSPGVYLAGQGYAVPTRDGVVLSGGNQCQPVASDMPNMSLLTHEQCHDVFGWPDLYDYDVFSGEYVNTPCGNFDLMVIGGGMYHGHPSLKFGMNGLVPQELNYGVSPILVTKGSGPKSLLLYPIERVADQYYVYRNDKNPGEYFTIYYNAADLTGTSNLMGDQASPYRNPISRGVVITHTDTGTALGRPMQQRGNDKFTWSVVQADGLHDMEDGRAGAGPGDTFGTTNNNKMFTDMTIPPARWWDQRDSGLRILDIQLDPVDPYAPAKVVFEWANEGGSGSTASGIGTDWYWVKTGADTDQDGIPDSWEQYWFSDYPNPLAEVNALTDHDRDGLPDVAEWMARANPMWQTSWTNSVTNLPMNDALYDLDGDGLSNIQEFRDYKTNMRDIDTDDDGILDGDELNSNIIKPGGRRVTSPTYSMSPAIQRSLHLNTNDSFLIPESSLVYGYDRLGLTNWTVEAWVNLDTDNENGFFVWRETIQGAMTFVIGVSNNVPFTGFAGNPSQGGEGGAVYAAQPIPASNWVHIAGVFDPNNFSLSLYINGEMISGVSMLGLDFSMPAFLGGLNDTGYTYLGGGVNGLIDEVRIWSRARSAEDVAAAYDKIINSPWVVSAARLGASMGNDGSLVVNLRFDDSQNLTNRIDYGLIAFGAEDFVHPTNWDYAVRGMLTSAFVTNAPDLRISDLIPDPIDDLNEDGIPDWWQAIYWRDFNPRSSGPWDGSEDPDGDFLDNVSEYLLDSNPRAVESIIGGPGLRVRDDDNDGLSNADEVSIYGTDPRNPDTDDDGIIDGDEILNLTNPLFSDSPYARRSIVLNRKTETLPEGSTTSPLRFSMSEWTIEMWVNLLEPDMTGNLINRTLMAQLGGFTNFAIEVSNNVPYAYFTTTAGRRVDVGGDYVLPANEWTHLAAVYDPTRHTLELIVNGVCFRAQATLEHPAVGYGRTTLGSTNVAMMVDDFRIYNHSRTHATIAAERQVLAPWFADLRITRIGTHFYQVFTNRVSWNQATNLAALAGGYLVTIESAKENNAVAALAVAAGVTNDWVWLGASVDTNGGWNWIDGRSVSNGYDNWAHWMAGGVTPMTEPDGGVAPNYLAMDPLGFAPVYVEPGEWFDVSATPSPYIVEYESMSPFGGPVAWYTFDDGENTNGIDAITGRSVGKGAEDYTHPMNWRYALQGVVFTNDVAPIEGVMDSNSDRIPDWWADLWYGREVVWSDDPDNDGLNQLYEFMSHTNPEDKDTDDDSVLDGDEDSDGDGLLNSDEQIFGCDPRLMDTDDDGILDSDEKRWKLDLDSDPADSLKPFVNRAMKFPGTVNDYVDMPLDLRFALTNWTVQAKVRSGAVWSAAGAVLYHQIGGGVGDNEVTNTIYGSAIVQRRSAYRETRTDNYVLGIDRLGRPVAGFGELWVGGTAPMLNDGKTWITLTATYDSLTGELKLYVGGTEVDRRTSAAKPSINWFAPVVQRIGEGFNGEIDEVRIWNAPLAATNIVEYWNRPLEGNESGLVAYYRFDDGTSWSSAFTPQHGTSRKDGWNVGQVEDFADAFGNDWLHNWFNAASIHGNLEYRRLLPSVRQVTSPNPDGTYYPTDTIDLRVIFSEPVKVDGTPILYLDVGFENVWAFYLSGSGSDTLTFRYVVQSNHWSLDLDYVDVGSLSANGGTIRTIPNDPVTLTLPVPGGVGSLSWSKDLFIDPPGIVNGMSKAWMRDNFGTLAVDGSADADGDGQPNVNEYLSLTDPNDKDSRLVIESITAVLAGGHMVQWQAVPGMTYRLSYSDSLMGGVWTTWSTVEATDDPMEMLDDGSQTGGILPATRFYRVEIQQP